MDFIVIAPQSWAFDRGSNARNITLEISKKHRVIYVNPPRDWFTIIKTKDINLNKTDKLTQVEKNVWVLNPSYIASSINWIRNKTLYDFLNRRNNVRFAKTIKRALAELNFETFIIFNDNHIFKGLYLKELLKPLKYIYYIRDYLTIQPYFKRHGERLEPEMIKEADAIVANSVYLKEYGEKFNKKAFYVGQGCETEMFNPNIQYTTPEDFRSIANPTIGYIGFLTSMRLDISLIEAIAKSDPKWNVVLVGPEDEDFKNSNLHQLENVYFLGRKDPIELPAYVNAFDVCINPQVINQLTIGNYPRKIDEYLAMGKPTVATKTRAMDVFAEHTYLASSSEEFISQIEAALRERDESKKAKRIAFAQSHTWENSMKEIYNVIELLSETA